MRCLDKSAASVWYLTPKPHEFRTRVQPFELTRSHESRKHPGFCDKDWLQTLASLVEMLSAQAHKLPGGA